MKVSKEMDNLAIAELLRAVAAAYTVKGEKKNKFRIVAYERAADAVEHLSSEAKDLWDEGELTSVAGIGESMAEHLGEIFKSGKSKHFEKVFGGLPPSMFEFLPVTGIGPKSAYKLASKLPLAKNAISGLKKAAKEGRIANLEGFGADSEAEILAGIEEYEQKPEKRILLPRATQIASDIGEWMSKCEAAEKIDVLGSLRRMASTIGDIDFAVASDKPEEVLDHFVNYPKKVREIERGEKKASILLAGKVRVDVLVASADQYGAALQHFTGSKHHNIALRELAQKKKLSLSEYGIRTKNNLQEFKTEKEFYRFLGLEYIEPELREGVGEISEAKNGKLPKLLEPKDIKGDLHIHSSFDVETSHDLGESSMAEIVKRANELSYEYVAMTEHNPSQRGHNENEVVEILKRKREKIEEINYSLKKKSKKTVRKVYNSLEIDMLKDGSLPVNNAGLQMLDFALVSIHSSFRLSKREMTARVLTALSHPKVKIFAHPTGRKINYREGVELEWKQIFEFCLKHDKWIEINASPTRLDLPDFLVREAVKLGVKLSMGTDAHSLGEMDNMKWAVSVARRGWTERSDIVNSLAFSEIEKMI